MCPGFVQVAWLGPDGKYDMDNRTVHSGKEVLDMLAPGFGHMPHPYPDNPIVTLWLEPLAKVSVLGLY